jgi:formylglycine-generating enzyme required for sulfatase activity
MGVVYEARHVTLGSRAAIKLLVRGGDPELSKTELVIREALAATTARHPGVVHVFDVGALDDGTPYILMEYVEGEVLRDRLRNRGRLSEVEATRILRQLASTLASIHAGGVVHQDLKPENIILVRDDIAEGGERAKLLDFGVARTPSPGAPPSAERLSIVGTPAYMSPEQCSAAEITPAADIYALGVLYCEMLTGKAPFLGDPATVVRKHLYAPLDDEVIERIPSSSRALLERMLAKSPVARPAASEIAASFLPTLSSPRLTTEPTAIDPRAPSRPPASRRAALWATLVALAVGLSCAGLLLARRKPPTAPAQLTGMVYLPGGAFTMGRTAAEADAECTALGTHCRRDVLDREQPARQVSLSPFYLDVNEVTKGAFLAWALDRTLVLDFYDDGPADEPRQLRLVKDRASGQVLLDFDRGWNWVDPVGPDRISLRPEIAGEPAVGVSWDAATQFCAHQGKRLPTDAEWEFAARGKTSRRYPWGDAPPTCDGALYGRLDELPCAGMPRGTIDVQGSTQDWSPEGVHDLFGNASEWVQDAYVAPYLPDCGACRDPVVLSPAPGGIDERVTRGGSWMLYMFGQTSARARWRRDSVTMGLGFRCAVSAR